MASQPPPRAASPEPVVAPLSPSAADAEEELPARGTTLNLLSQWRSMEGEKKPEVVAPKVKSTSVSKTQHQQKKHVEEVNAVHLLEDEELGGRAVAENEPQRTRDDVIRAEDPNANDVLPPPKFTRTMLARFQTLETDVQQQKTPSPKKVRVTAQYHTKYRCNMRTQCTHVGTNHLFHYAIFIVYPQVISR